MATLAKCMGFFASMFEPAKELICGTQPLRNVVKQLSLKVFKQLLESEGLQLQFENDAYALLVAWLRQSPHAQKKRRRAELFKELAPLMRYHHMTHDFVINAVSTCPLMNESGLGLSVMRSAFVQRDASPVALERRHVERGLSNRGVAPSSASWEIKASFTLEEVEVLEPGGTIRKWCGVVAGYPAALQMQRVQKDGHDTLGAYLLIDMPKDKDAPIPGPKAGVMLKYNMTLTPNVKTSLSHHFAGQGWGWPNVLGKPWAEAVREGSPHFPNGKLEIKATMKMLVKE